MEELELDALLSAVLQGGGEAGPGFRRRARQRPAAVGRGAGDGLRTDVQPGVCALPEEMACLCKEVSGLVQRLGSAGIWTGFIRTFNPPQPPSGRPTSTIIFIILRNHRYAINLHIHQIRRDAASHTSLFFYLCEDCHQRDGPP